MIAYRALSVIRGKFGHSRVRMATSALPSASVAVVTTVACPYCRKAKSALMERGIAFIEVDVSNNSPLRSATAAVTGRKTVPQIFVSGTSIGGCDDLMSQLESGAFITLVESSAGLPPLPPSLMAYIEDGKSNEITPTKEDEYLQKAMDKIKDKFGHAFKINGGLIVEALESIYGSDGRDAALALAKSLLENNLISPSSTTRPPPGFNFSLDQEYLIVSLAPLPSRNQGLPLNRHYWWQGPSRPAPLLSAHLRGLILNLFDKYLSSDGRSVSYEVMSKDPMFRKFVDATAELQSVDLTTLEGKEEELVAFFINLYNALVIHALATWDEKGNSFYSAIKYDIGGLAYSADDIENGVLRGNKPGAANPWSLIGLPQMSKGQFPDPGDPRRKVIALSPDARIHFALNCGARSCPPIRVFTADNLDEGLEAAAESFCGSEVQVDVAKKEVRVNKIFNWYRADFGSSPIDRLRFIRKFLRGKAREDLDMLLADEGGKGIKLGYLDYDWTVNKK